MHGPSEQEVLSPDSTLATPATPLRRVPSVDQREVPERKSFDAKNPHAEILRPPILFPAEEASIIDELSVQEPGSRGRPASRADPLLLSMGDFSVRKATCSVGHPRSTFL